ncbi:MAG: glutamate synthase subunit beta [Candidatus Bipolaricaulia bacterium]
MASENHPQAFLHHPREPVGKRAAEERVYDWDEIWRPDWNDDQLRSQGERCMDCGTPTCMAGCPLGNLIPDWNDLVSKADWRRALERLHATNNFPEFTGYTCPAPCESTCVLAVNDDPVAIKDIERAIVDRGWAEGWIGPQPPTHETGFHVAIVGSGPAGLAAAQQLRRVGHRVTLLERDDAIGGLMTYGIPDFKFAKSRVERRVQQLRDEGIALETGVDVGQDVSLADLGHRFSAVGLALGAQRPRAIPLPGADLKGVRYAMPYLIRENRRQAGRSLGNDDALDAADRRVVVLGGGDTGADCVATALRQGAREVVQISIHEQPPAERPADNPWPELPKTYHKSYAQEEGAVEAFGVETTELIDEDGDGHVDALLAERVKWRYNARGRRVSKDVIDSSLRIPCDLALVAIGFRGPDADWAHAEGLELSAGATFTTDDRLMTSQNGVFACGDARVGASLVVTAIADGRDMARQIDRFLRGRTSLPASLHTPNAALETT